MNAQMAVPPPRLAYLVSQYPLLSMIFVIREVVELRRRGCEINVISINDSDRSGSALTDLEREENRLTHYVKSEGALSAMAAHVLGVLRAPGGYFRELLSVFRQSHGSIRRLFYQYMYFTEALMIGRWMRATGHSHLHVHLGNQAATVGMFVKRIFGLGFSITIHGSDEFYDSRGQLLREKVAAADFIVCISHFARSQLLREGTFEQWDKFEVCRLGVDTETFRGNAHQPTADRIDILCVGRLTSSKGQYILVLAINELRQRNKNVYLRIVGDGLDRRLLEDKVSKLGLGEYVKFEGPVTQDRIGKFYAEADIFVLPSFAEGLPVVLMEAMAMGVPVVSTTVAGIPELIRHERDGLLVAPSDVAGLAAAIEKLVDDPALRARFAANAREVVEARYNLQTNVAQLDKVFRSRVRVR